MRILTSKPALRWLAPVVVVGAVATTSLVASNAQADNALPPIGAEQLLTNLQNSEVDGLSGTVFEKADLGIPAIPGASSTDGAGLTSLVSGTHTLRVRYAGPDKSRIAVFDTLGETDVIANGRDLWTWSSKDRTATHRAFSGDAASQQDKKAPADAPQTPQEAAAKVLGALNPSTTVGVDTSAKIAERTAYELVLEPNDDASLIKQVRIAVDSENWQPLQVQVLAENKKVVFQVGYTDVNFSRPGNADFEFNPPPGTTVTEKATPERKAPTAKEKAAAQDKAEQAKSDTKVVGTGWSTVVVTKLDASDPTNAKGQLGDFLNGLREVPVPGGQGKLLKGTAFTAILTDDGRLAVGAVKEDLLIQALGK